MASKQDIQSRLKEALREGNRVEAGTLRGILAAMLNKEKENQQQILKEQADLAPEEVQERSQLSEEAVQELLQAEAKRRRESIEAFEQGGRAELAAQEQQELEIIQSYLPDQFSEEEVRTLVKEAIEKTGASSMQDMGAVMAELMPVVQGRADGKTVSALVKEELS